MSDRTMRRIIERRARKLAEKINRAEKANPGATAGPAPNPDLPQPASQAQDPQPAQTPKPSRPASAAQVNANQKNSQFSTGPTSTAGLAASSQNRTSHGLARHLNGAFQLLKNESETDFAAFKQALVDEHQPSSETECLLVNAMAEAQWLCERAQRLQHTCINPDNGEITDQQKWSLYFRYQNTHDRAFHRKLNTLLKLRAETQKSVIGFEALNIQKEKHQMKKSLHEYDLFIEDLAIHNETCDYTSKLLKLTRDDPRFAAQFDHELRSRGLRRTPKEEIISSAA